LHVCDIDRGSRAAASSLRRRDARPRVSVPAALRSPETGVVSVDFVRFETFVVKDPAGISREAD
jgi:hypothetical protein